MVPGERQVRLDLPAGPGGGRWAGRVALRRPARAADLTGLPPTYIGAAALDLLVHQNLDFARRLIAAGVPTQLEVYPRTFHGFDVGSAPVSETFKRNRLAVLRRGLGIDGQEHP
ncbi:alpha/beta hydrolase fold domain-containing protein [Pseudonocardia sp. HH130629-09]|uniref:alpha/beta hydrolase fold domain-containing protein n=1 Tax=Pseudonocardia sp. HH130629-09 TaxID=1641402 RepID=UPI001930E7D8